MAVRFDQVPGALRDQREQIFFRVGLAQVVIDTELRCVLDSAKARALLGKAANSPELLVDQAPPLVAPHHALRGARLNRGEVFYILFPNARASVKAGVDVTVAMGEARLGPVRVQ